MNKEEISAALAVIEEQMNNNDFWNNPTHAQAVVAEYSRLQKKLEKLNAGISGSVYADYPAIVTIMSGAGGDDSEDFTRMLYQMYQSFCEKNNLFCKLIKSNQNPSGGYRSLTFKVEGDNAFELLRYESGVHRLIRISPFNAKGKRQTSFCMVEVVPEIISDADLELKKDDLDIQFTKSGGPGGQNVNKRETAVRIVHKPTGIAVHVDGERTQEANREEAMTMIRGKLALLEMQKVSDAIGQHQVDKNIENEWGSQIRTYTLNPYKLVKDHRTGVETTNTDSVLKSGDILQFTDSLREQSSISDE